MKKIEKGSSYLSSPDHTPRGKFVRHLRIVISDFDELDRALVIPITTWYEESKRQDDSCILNAGDHSMITHKSWADYSRAESMSYKIIQENIAKGIFIAKENVSKELLTRLQKGAKKSDFLQRAFEHFFLDF